MFRGLLLIEETWCSIPQWDENDTVACEFRSSLAYSSKVYGKKSMKMQHKKKEQEIVSITAVKYKGNG